MEWIFGKKKEEEEKPEVREKEELLQTIKNKLKIFKELIDHNTIDPNNLSEQELEYLNAHPARLRNDLCERIKDYRRYCAENINISMDWDFAKIKELKESDEVKESILKQKKIQ